MDNSKKRVLVFAASEALKGPNFKAAMDKEIAAFRKNDCIEELRLADLEDNVNAVSTRWVFPIKKGMTETRFNARLVARGYEDAENENISSDSPVASAAAQRLVLAACAERHWIPHSWDFSTAFLQGKYIDRKSDIVIAPPDGYAAAGIGWGLKSLFTAYALLPNPGTIASGKLPLLLDLTVTSLTMQYFVFSTALEALLESWLYT
jgi:Reverse transcriptase (RNA-dependent DNA polymerase)